MPYSSEYCLALRDRLPHLLWSGQPSDRSYNRIQFDAGNLGKSLFIHPSFDTTDAERGFPNICVNIEVKEPAQTNRLTDGFNQIVTITAPELRSVSETPSLIKFAVTKPLLHTMVDYPYSASDPFIWECLDWHVSKIGLILDVLQAPL
jgi:hypothetical protein